MNANFTNEQVAEAIAEFIQELKANAATEYFTVADIILGVGYNGNITIFKSEQNENTAS